MKAASPAAAPPSVAAAPLSVAAFATLLLIALMIGANHVAARVAFDHGVDVTTAVAFRSAITALVVMALDVLGAASGLGAAAQWAQIGAGVAFALAAAALFGAALVLTQHEAADVDGRLRTALTLGLVGVLAIATAQAQGGFHWPTAALGWWGLLALTFLYGTAFTIMFTVLPKLGVVGSSPIMNVEPIFALVLAWALLGQTIAPLQVAGGLLVVATVVWLGLRRA